MRDKTYTKGTQHTGKWKEELPKLKTSKNDCAGHFFFLCVMFNIFIVVLLLSSHNFCNFFFYSHFMKLLDLQ